jgi:hypothetical protein
MTKPAYGPYAVMETAHGGGSDSSFVRTFSTFSSPARNGPDAPAVTAGLALWSQAPAGRPARLGADSTTPRPVSGAGRCRRDPGARLYPPASRRGPKRGRPDRALGGQQELPDLPGKATAPLAPGPMQDTDQTLAPSTLTVVAVNPALTPHPLVESRRSTAEEYSSRIVCKRFGPTRNKQRLGVFDRR